MTTIKLYVARCDRAFLVGDRNDLSAVASDLRVVSELMRYITAREIAARLGVSESLAYNIMKEMEHVKVNRLIRVTEAAFAKYLERRTKPALDPRAMTSSTNDYTSWYQPRRPGSPRSKLR